MLYLKQFQFENQTFSTLYLEKDKSTMHLTLDICSEPACEIAVATRKVKLEQFVNLRYMSVTSACD